MQIQEALSFFNNELKESDSKLIAISKTYSSDVIFEAYKYGQLAFGENKVQEMVSKYETLPKNIAWHQVGHLQTNKVKFIAPFVSLIHSIDSLSLLQVVNKEAIKNNRIISCLLQIHIASEVTKFGFSENEAIQLLEAESLKVLSNVNIVGLMGMASNTSDLDQVRNEFKNLKMFFDLVKNKYSLTNVNLSELSMGMSGDYKIAIEEGSTMIRVGSAIFGSRI